MSELKQVLMRRDEMSSIEADALIAEMREDIRSGRDPEDVLYDIGLEPDYIFDLI